MFELRKEDYMSYLREVAAQIHDKEEYITELDAETGDGDHWLNLDTGFQKLTEKMEEWSACSYAEFYRNIGMTMMSAMGGSSGVLYGSAYLKTSKLLEGKDEITPKLLSDILEGWASAIAQRGNTKPGFKTMLDTIYPASKAYARAIEKGEDSKSCLEELKRGAKEGAESTKNMEAVRGRASYREDKSVGYLDPGAVTMSIQLECLAEFIIKNLIK